MYCVQFGIKKCWKRGDKFYDFLEPDVLTQTLHCPVCADSYIVYDSWGKFLDDPDLDRWRRTDREDSGGTR